MSPRVNRKRQKPHLRDEKRRVWKITKISLFMDFRDIFLVFVHRYVTYQKCSRKELHEKNYMWGEPVAGLTRTRDSDRLLWGSQNSNIFVQHYLSLVFVPDVDVWIRLNFCLYLTYEQWLSKWTLHFGAVKSSVSLQLTPFQWNMIKRMETVQTGFWIRFFDTFYWYANPSTTQSWISKEKKCVIFRK